ncbi:flagellar assembly protein A [Salsuginibacillus kocurii]|uniref:flagellar assembly protein A n=1 Tax=Salsuginibacillus kocurii TaxID=427078 RepID=UPI0003810B81|nr:flagellar assembly protein A [Salsuginibacillus kocurii]
MSKFKEFTAETVELAVQQAETFYNVGEQELEIDVLQHEKKNWLNQLKQSAVIKVALKDEVESKNEASIEQLLGTLTTNSSVLEWERELVDADKRGKAWIKDGTLFTEDGKESFPIVYPGDGVRLLVNEEEVKEKCPVKESDDVTLEVENERVETKWKVEVNGEGDSITLKVTPGYFLIRKLINKPPSNQLVLETTDKYQANNELQIADVINQLEKQRIQYGINYESIKEATLVEKEGEFVIAEGRPAVDGKNGEADFTVDVNKKRVQPEEQVDGSVDYREINFIPNIEEGHVLANIQPPEPGKDGMNVYGNVVKARDGAPVVVKAGRGVAYIEEEQRVVATEDGRPYVDNRGQMVQVSVMHRLVHSQNVNIETGNLSFIGDIDIYGSVEENMRVKADGELFIKGYAEQSVLHSGHSLTVSKNVIRSTVVAGNQQLIYAKIGEALSPVKEQIKHIISALKQLHNSKSFHESNYANLDVKALLNLLIKEKFNSLPEDINTLNQLINENEKTLEREWHSLRDYLHHQFILHSGKTSNTVDELMEWYKKIIHLLEMTAAPVEANVEVKIGYATNSHVFSCGDIHIFGHGSVNSTLQAAGVVRVEKQLIGGQLLAGKDAHIGVSGSPAGAKTEIVVPENHKVTIGYAYVDTVVFIGSRKYFFHYDQKNVVLYIENDEVVARPAGN